MDNERKILAIKTRLETLRQEIRLERISTGEIIELQGYVEHIDKDDVELLQWAGVPEVEEEIDLFENPENLPQAVQDVINKYCTGDNTYENCGKLVAELEALGYTCEYGLDAEPHSLKKIYITEEMANKALEFPELMLLGILNGELDVETCRQQVIEQSKINQE